jgi:hypothetical protein
LVDIADLKSEIIIFHNFRNYNKNQPNPIISTIYTHLSVVGNSGNSVCSCTNTALLPHYAIEGDAAGNLPLFCYITEITDSLYCVIGLSSIHMILTRPGLGDKERISLKIKEEEYAL